jgi:coenzyme F420-reducing hydrogenase alpha subunit
MTEDRDNKEFKIKVGSKSRTIHVDYLARVEGEGSLFLKTKDQKVEEVQLKIFEPPRFFEALLRGRNYTEAPDITARICGICPVAYQMSAVYAMEDALGLSVDESIHKLRRLIYCGEWIESHTLHMYMLHAPDFLGHLDAMQMAKGNPEILMRGLRIKKAGNEIIRLIGGREIHPINVKVAGFYKMPKKEELVSLAEILKKGRDDAIASVYWASTLPFPDLHREYEYVSLTSDQEYPMARGVIRSSSGLTITAHDFDKHFSEQHVAHSTAMHTLLNGKDAYLVGPMARYHLNYDRLPQSVKQLAQQISFERHCTNPFRSIIIRALEVLFAFEEALKIIEEYQDDINPQAPFVFKKEAEGFAATEAPRGLLYHRYRLLHDGTIADAKIIPPTSQNQKTIENDLFIFASQNLNLPDEELRWRCEMAIRNFDPCISCAAHFLQLKRHHA